MEKTNKCQYCGSEIICTSSIGMRKYFNKDQFKNVRSDKMAIVRTNYILLKEVSRDIACISHVLPESLTNQYHYSFYCKTCYYKYGKIKRKYRVIDRETETYEIHDVQNIGPSMRKYYEKIPPHRGRIK